MPETTTTYEHPCPECGGDVCITRQRPQGILHRASIIAIGIWCTLLVLCAAYSLPWVQDKAGNQLAIYTSASDEGLSEYCSPFTPAISIADLRNDTIAPQEFSGALTPMYEAHGRWWANTRFRFVFIGTDGTRYDQRTQGFGGIWIGEYATTVFTDVSHEPVGDGPWDYPIDAVVTEAYSNFIRNDRSWFGLQIQQARLDGGQSYSRSINIFQILISFVSVISVTHFGLRLLWFILGKLDRVPGSYRWIHRAAILVAFVVVLVFGVRMSTEYHHISGVDITKLDPNHIGPWIEPEQIEQYLDKPDHPEPLIAYLRELTQDVPEHKLIAYQVTQDTDTKSITEYTILNAQLRYNAELMSFGRIRFLQSGPNATTSSGTLPGYLEPGLFLDHAPDWGSVWIGYNSDSDSRYVVFYWTRLIFAGFVAWIILRLFLWIARLFVYRAQRKRVRRDQCIFCAYPLNEHALQCRRDTNPQNRPTAPPKMIDPDLI